MSETKNENKLDLPLDPEATTLSRNEPCSCGSGKKYKRCCGVGASPKMTPPKESPAGGFGEGNAPFDPSSFGDLDPQQILHFSNALKRLPKGQLQRLQSLMQKAMSGRDVSKEAMELEKSLPPDFQKMVMGFGGMGMETSENQNEVSQNIENNTESEPTEESHSENESDKKFKLNRLWKMWGKKKKS